MARTRRSEATEAESNVSAFFAPNYAAVLQKLEKNARLTQGSMSIAARQSAMVSTGMLGTDVMLGGGLLGGRWYTFFGGEGSAKSTGLAHMKMSAATYKVPILLDMDYEGSSVPDYYDGIMEYSSKLLKKTQDLYGLQDPDGNWILPPKMRYYNPVVAEDFFNPVSSMLRQLPDKVFLEDRWFYAWDADKAGRAAAGDRYSKTMYSRYQRLFVEAENGLPQAIFFLDSYPAMFPEALDDDDAGRGMAAIARAMAENVPKIFSKLRPKNVIVAGVNQLRQRPGFNMGDPSYEPAGDTLKFVSSARVRQTARSVPHGKGPIELEESAIYENRKDSYRYIHMKAIKNKISTPYLESWQRVWVDDGTGTAHGFCPVWDTFQYLKNTGQMSGNMKKFRINLPNMELTTTWLGFKALILTNGKDRVEVCKSLGLKQDPKIRERCQAQLKKGDGLRLYFDHISSGNPDSAEG